MSQSLERLAGSMWCDATIPSKVISNRRRDNDDDDDEEEEEEEDTPDDVVDVDVDSSSPI